MSTELGYLDNLEHLADELHRLDLMIRARLSTLAALNDLSPQSQTARTVYISREEVAWLLAPAPAPPPDGAVHGELELASQRIEARLRQSHAAGVSPRLAALGRRFGLSAAELRAVVVCLAPELRRKYDRLYAYLQDDITRKRPSADLILDLLHADEADRWRARALFDDASALLRLGILRAFADQGSPSGSTGLARFLALDPRICSFLLGGDDLDARLIGLARLHLPSPGPEPQHPAAAGLIRLAGRAPRAFVIALYGPAGVGRRELAAQVCAGTGRSMLSLDLRAIPGADAERAELVRVAVREAVLQHAAICLTGAEELANDDARPLLAALGAALADLGGLAFLCGQQPWPGAATLGEVPVHVVALALPDVGRAAELWRRALGGLAADPPGWAAELADRFRLTPAAIRAAVAAADRHRLAGDPPRALALSDVYAACRELSAGRLSDLAAAIHPACGWDDLVLPADRVELLRDIGAQVRHHHRVFGGWGFGARGSRGTGLTALFSGPPGTGKTMAAEVLAGDLGLDLYKVDLSGVVNKYIGETEKNLRKVFAEARSSNAVLFFDEADALFGKRTEVSDAHDRYANIETSYLLQQMEQYDGVVVLATNLRQNLDEAFTRRIRFIVEFPFPDADTRARIWRAHFPAAAPLADDVDVASLAREFPVAGGTIRNIVLNAAFLAAADGGVIDRRHILHGTRREFEKIGRLWTEPAALNGAPR
ncbi:ATP-binding protein [Actinoplanes sp. NPDC026623]|uniref:ATP-binding protein n=1 Tax=Actinoplanes sp. NPDC026623 TaxID=3155610 RepID=UPI0033D6A8D1